MSEEAQILEGDLQHGELPRVLLTLAFQQSTGILTVQGEDDIVAVSYLNGQIVTADALNQTLEEGLGEVLAQKDLVSRENFAAVAKEHQASGGSIGELLVGHGLLSREQLLEAMRYQTYWLMLQVLTWHQGEFKFYGGDEVSFEKGIPPISIEELLIRAVAEVGAESGLPGSVPKLDGVYRQVPPRGPVQILGREGDGTGDGIWVNDLQAAFLQRTDGSTSALAIARSLNSGRYKALFSLYQLLQLDLIEFVAVAQPGSARPGTGAIPVTTATGAPAPAAPEAPPPAAAPTPPPSAAVAIAMGPGARHPPKTKPAPRVERAVTAAAAPGLPRPWVGPLFALAFLLFLVFGLLNRPGAFLLPYSWLDIERIQAEQQIEQSLFQRADRAAGIYFLMESHYPAQLDELVERGLLSPTDRRDPSGRTLRYTNEELSYRIELVARGQVVEGQGATGAIAGNFVLDPQFIGEEEMRNPLVLLD